MLTPSQWLPRNGWSVNDSRRPRRHRSQSVKRCSDRVSAFHSTGDSWQSKSRAAGWVSQLPNARMASSMEYP